MEACVLGSRVTVRYWHFCYQNTTWTHSIQMAWKTSGGIKIIKVQFSRTNKQVSASALHQQMDMCVITIHFV